MSTFDGHVSHADRKKEVVIDWRTVRASSTPNRRSVIVPAAVAPVLQLGVPWQGVGGGEPPQPDKVPGLEATWSLSRK